ncbi:hypothetical protein [Streptomyces sp. NBC_00566]|uniref:hypothetical protein n=1 Tax=Streptomyces sp. NBC_00566 TaxID=2975778 RepID=UPI002E81A02C|nr:hypothetical protein [Streptomyces sp. NBC_00566]WUB85160.1 hypothetical protein OG812_00380 [Streptomyces sp. NBC_00566]
MNLPGDESDVEELIKAAGFRSWTAAGSVLAVPLTLAVWARPEEPSFLFDLDGADHSEWFYAATLPDALVLLNQLAPTLQALTVTEQVAQAEPKKYVCPR